MALLLLNACSVACSVASVLVLVPPLLTNRKEMDIKKTGRSGGLSPVASCVAGPLVSLFFYLQQSSKTSPLILEVRA